jgi:hypothetical protein
MEKGDLMKKGFGIVVVMMLSVGVSSAEVVKKWNLDDASSVTPKIEIDVADKSEGSGSLKIKAQWPTTICLGEVTGLDVENSQLIFSAKVKTELEGSAFLEMWVDVNGGQFFSRGINDAVSQKTHWKTSQTFFTLQKGQKPEKVTLNLVVNGKGTVWIDDLVLTKENNFGVGPR